MLQLSGMPDIQDIRFEAVLLYRPPGRNNAVDPVSPAIPEGQLLSKNMIEFLILFVHLPARASQWQASLCPKKEIHILLN